MRLVLNKRLKIAIGITATILVLGSGAIFGLAKTGVIHIKMLADEPNQNTPGNGDGLKGEYYQRDMIDSSPQLKLSRIDPNVNYNWGLGSPDQKILADHYSIRWSGQVQAFGSGQYTFYTKTDDGVKLYVNGELVIDKWRVQGASDYFSPAISLKASEKYNIIMDYYESTIDAEASLSWSGPGFTRGIIPKSQLYSVASASLCGDQQCEKNQTCRSQGGFEGQPVTYYCEDNITPPNTTADYIIRGIIKGMDQKIISGASIEIWDKTDANNPEKIAAASSGPQFTGDNGQKYNYQTTVFARPVSNTYQKIFLKITSGNFSGIELDLSATGTFIGVSNRDGIEYDQVKDLAFSQVSTGKFDLRGLLQDENDNLISNIPLSISCVTTPADTFEKCKSKFDSSYPYTNSLDHKITGQEANYQISNIYDFSQADSPFDSVLINVQLPDQSYYYDANNNNNFDSNEAGSAHLLLKKDEIKPPASDMQNSYLIKNIKLRKIDLSVTLHGMVVAAENQNLGVSAEIIITSPDKPDEVIDHVSTDGSGKYQFSDLRQKVAIDQEYRLAIIPDDIERSAEITEIKFSRGGKEYNVILAKNAGGQITTFEGTVSRVNGDVIEPVSGASVNLTQQSDLGVLSLLEPDRILGSPVLTDARGHYTLSIPDINLNAEESDAPLNVRLSAFSGGLPLLMDSPEVSSKIFQLSEVQGARIFQDFVFGHKSDLADPVDTKTVRINIQKVIRKYRNTSNSELPETYDENMGGFEGIKVKLACTRTISSANSSNFVAYTQEVISNRNGVAKFNKVPKSDCRIVYSIGSEWNVTGDSLLKASDESAKLTFWRYDIDPNVLSRAEDRIRLAQTVGEWKDRVPYRFRKPMRKTGCCIASLAMTMRYYYPEKNITPSTLLDFGDSEQIDMHVSNFPNYVEAFDRAKQTKLHLVRLDGNNIDSEVQKYLKMGVPVIWYAADNRLANMTKGGTYNTHCVVLTGYIDNSSLNYRVIDSYDGNSYNYRRDQLGGFGGASKAYAVLDDRMMTGFETRTNNVPSSPQTNITNNINIPNGATTGWHENIKTTAFAGICDTSEKNRASKKSWCDKDETALASAQNMEECLTCKDDVDNCIGYSGIFTGCNRPTDYYAALPYFKIAALCEGNINNCPRIEVQYGGRSIILAVVDAGPYSTKDSDYVLNNASPTRNVGLDISPEAMKSLGASSGVKMRWRFVEQNATTSFNEDSTDRNIAQITDSASSIISSAEASDQTVAVKALGVVKVNAKINTISAIPVSEVFISLNLKNSKTVSLRMKKTSDNGYQITIPRNYVTADFKYSIVAYNLYGSGFKSTFTYVKVGKPNPAQSFEAKVFSATQYIPSALEQINSASNNTWQMVKKTIFQVL